MFFLLSKTLDLLFTPLCWALLLAVAASWIAHRGRMQAARRLWLASALVLYLPSTGLGSHFLWLQVVQFDGPRVDSHVTYDAAILLGGFATRLPGGRLELADGVERLFGTFELLRSGQAHSAIITSGCDEVVCESDVIAGLLVDMGIARDRLLVGRESVNTRDNALEVRKLLQSGRFTRLALVTSAFHMQRALDTLHAAGIAADALAVDYQTLPVGSWFEAVVPRASHLDKSTRALREFLGRWVYHARGFARSRR